jgi:hypothetical protein
VRTLERAEEKLGLIARFAEQEKTLLKIRRILLADELTAAARHEALSLLEGLLE